MSQHLFCPSLSFFLSIFHTQTFSVDMYSIWKSTVVREGSMPPPTVGSSVLTQSEGRLRGGGNIHFGKFLDFCPLDAVPQNIFWCHHCWKWVFIILEHFYSSLVYKTVTPWPWYFFSTQNRILTLKLQVKYLHLKTPARFINTWFSHSSKNRTK